MSSMGIKRVPLEHRGPPPPTHNPSSLPSPRPRDLTSQGFGSSSSPTSYSTYNPLHADMPVLQHIQPSMPSPFNYNGHMYYTPDYYLSPNTSTSVMDGSNLTEYDVLTTPLEEILYPELGAKPFSWGLGDPGVGEPDPALSSSDMSNAMSNELLGAFSAPVEPFENIPGIDETTSIMADSISGLPTAEEWAKLIAFEKELAEWQERHNAQATAADSDVNQTQELDEAFNADNSMVSDDASDSDDSIDEVDALITPSDDGVGSMDVDMEMVDPSEAVVAKDTATQKTEDAEDTATPITPSSS